MAHVCSISYALLPCFTRICLFIFTVVSYTLKVGLFRFLLDDEIKNFLNLLMSFANML